MNNNKLEAVYCVLTVAAAVLVGIVKCACGGGPPKVPKFPKIP